MSASTTSGNRFGLLPLVILFLLAGFSHRTAAAEYSAPTNVIRTAAAVRSLTSEQASRHYPVVLRGVVTFSDATLFCNFIQDETAGRAQRFYRIVTPMQ